MKNNTPYLKYLLLLFILAERSFQATAQAPGQGGIVIQSNVDDHFLIIEDDFEHAIRITNADTVFLDPGKYRFKLASPIRNDFLFEEEISAGTITQKRVNFYSRAVNPESNSYTPLFWKANLMIFSERGAEIFVNGQRIGHSIAGINLDDKYAEIRVVNSQYSASKKVRVTPTRLQTYTVSTLPLKQKARMLSLLPGASQFYKDQPLKGSAILIGFISVSSTALFFNHRFSQADEDFVRYRTLYDNSTNPNEVFRYGQLAEKSLSDAEKYSNRRNAAILGLGAVYLLNLADGLLSKPERGFFEPWDFNPYVDFESYRQPSFGIQISRGSR